MIVDGYGETKVEFIFEIPVNEKKYRTLLKRIRKEASCRELALEKQKAEKIQKEEKIAFEQYERLNKRFEPILKI